MKCKLNYARYLLYLTEGNPCSYGHHCGHACASRPLSPFGQASLGQLACTEAAVWKQKDGKKSTDLIPIKWKGSFGRSRVRSVDLAESGTANPEIRTVHEI
jgi:hypothetical protein